MMKKLILAAMLCFAAPCFAASPDGTVITPTSRIVDAPGGVWTVDASGKCYRNGVWAGTCIATQLLFYDSSIYAEGGDGKWWKWVNNWVGVPVDPRLTPSYSTNFPVAGPLPAGLITANSPGVNWSSTLDGYCGCEPISSVSVLRPGLAGPPTSGGPYGDALAVVTGTWPANQTASAVVAPAAAVGSSIYQEVELHLRTNPATGQGYEIDWGLNHNYFYIVTWNGNGLTGVGVAWTIIYGKTGPAFALAPGDTVKASAVGNVITVWRNGTQVVSFADPNNRFPTGNPGFGFEPGGVFGISSFTASSP
jgi:hypothetical protein